MSFLLTLLLTSFSSTLFLCHLIGFEYIGLTGGISSGKSTSSRYLKQHHHCNIIDFDELAREAVRPGSSALAQLAATFGNNIINPIDQSLNRAVLGKILFGSPAARSTVNRIYIRPLLILLLKRSISLFLFHCNKTIILDVPLLFESSFYYFCRSTVLIYTDPSTQKSRLMARDNITSADADLRINAQWPLQRKRLLANIIIDNDQSELILQQQLDSFIQQQKSLSNRFSLYNLFIPSLPSVAIATTVSVIITSTVLLLQTIRFVTGK